MFMGNIVLGLIRSVHLRQILADFHPILSMDMIMLGLPCHFHLHNTRVCLHITLPRRLIMHVHPIVAYLRMICSNLNFGLDNVPRPTGSQNLKGDFEGVPYNKVIGQNAMFR